MFLFIKSLISSSVISSVNDRNWRLAGGIGGVG